MRLNTTATALPSATTPRTEAGPTLRTIRGVLAVCAIVGVWALRPGEWWPFAVAVSAVVGLLAIGDLGQLAAHAWGGVEWVTQRDLDGNGHIGTPGASRVVKELVYVRGVEPPSEVLDTGQGIAIPDDLRYFIDHLGALDAKGPTVRDWLGQTLPSGRTIEPDDFTALVAPLVNIRAIVGRGERTPGKIRMDKSEIKRRLRL